MRPARPYWLSAMLFACAPLWAQPPVQRASFDVKQQHIAKPAPTVRVPQGGTLVLELRSDTPLDVHLHGYDMMLKLKAGTPGSLQLQAHTAGRFPMAVHGKGHHHGPALLYVEVTPR